MGEAKRICQVVKLKPEFEEEYIKIHNPIPTEILDKLRDHHITDYSIHYYKEGNLLIANFKYTGDDWEKDAEEMRVDPVNHQWWAVTDKMQSCVLPHHSEGSHDLAGWWLSLSEVFRFE